MQEHNINNVKYLTFESLDKLNIVKNAFSTRIGGVSTGVYSSMNLGYTNGDLSESVSQNYHIIADTLNIKLGQIVRSKQVHTTNIMRIEKKDFDYSDILHDIKWDMIDGLITNVPGAMLTTFYADCVPLYFVDPIKKAIGLAHSGWRGTVSKMAVKMVEKMTQEYGCNPSDIYTAIGPSICSKCYEVSSDVKEEFERTFGDKSELIFTKSINEDKYMLDLWLANKLLMLEAGINESNIEISKLCTCCNSDFLYSHRASKGKRGNLAAFLMLNI